MAAGDPPAGVIRRAAVLGSPIGHSLSPALHRAAYAYLGLGWRYDGCECSATGLPDFLARVRRDPTWVGLSLTMPLKLVAPPLLDELDGVAATLLAVNTVVRVGDRLIGYNTDPDGIRAGLADIGCPGPAAATVLGAGGTALAALAALAAAGTARVALAVRDPGRATGPAEIGRRFGLQVRVVPLAPAALAGSDAVIAAMPASGTDQLAEAVRSIGWPAGLPLVEVVYAPWPTRLAAVVAAGGARVASGLVMLVGQARGQIHLMTDRDVPAGVLRAAGEAALGARAAHRAG